MYFGCLVTVLNSVCPCANWHFSPYLQVPCSENGLHNSVLYRLVLTFEELSEDAEDVCERVDELDPDPDVDPEDEVVEEAEL